MTNIRLLIYAEFMKGYRIDKSPRAENVPSDHNQKKSANILRHKLYIYVRESWKDRQRKKMIHISQAGKSIATPQSATKNYKMMNLFRKFQGLRD